MLNSMDCLVIEEVDRHVRAALAEDIGPGDATTLATVPTEAVVSALMVAREPLVVAGLIFAERAFQILCSDVAIVQVAADGEECSRNATLLKITGNAQAILTAERVALNFVQRLSGVATLTKRFIEQVAGTKAQILDTRKTTPGWRHFEKYAVQCGGAKTDDVRERSTARTMAAKIGSR